MGLSSVLQWWLWQGGILAADNDPWLIFAKQRGLTKVKGSPILRGVISGFQVEIRLNRTFQGERKEVWTSVCVQGLPTDIELGKGGLFSAGPEPVVADPAFDGVRCSFIRPSAIGRLPHAFRSEVIQWAVKGKLRLVAGRLVLRSACRQNLAGLIEMTDAAIRMAQVLRKTEPVDASLKQMATNDPVNGVRMEALRQLVFMDSDGVDQILANGPDSAELRVRNLVAIREKNWGEVVKNIANTSLSEKERWDAIEGLLLADEASMAKGLNTLWATEPSPLHVRTIRTIVRRKVRGARDGVLGLAKAMKRQQTVDPWSREAATLAISMIAGMGAHHPPSEDALILMTTLDAPRIQVAACRGLARMGGERAVNALSCLAEEADPVGKEARAGVAVINSAG